MHKIKIRVISFLLTAFLVLGGFVIQSRQEAAFWRQQIQLGYSHAFTELSTAMDELNTALQKGRYASSPPLLATLCTQIYGKSMSAQMALGELPYANVELEQTAAFVATAGDYALALARSAVQNGALNDVELEGLNGLASTSTALSERLRALQTDMDSGAFSLEDVRTAQDRLSSAQPEDTMSTGNALQDMETEFPEVPTLIYDGPFSQHLTDQAPKALEGLDQVDEETAKAAAADFLGLAPASLSLLSAGEGDLPAYSFSGEGYYIEVTRQGGAVLSVLRDELPAGEGLSNEEGVAAAVGFLSKRGYPEMAESYYIRQSNSLTVNFATVQEGVLCYTDLIKVSVSLADGSLTGFEAHGYTVNHHTRTLARPTVNAGTASAHVTPSLSILAHQLTLIPSAGEHEVLCHEFKCEAEDGSHVVVYVNALTDAQEKILILLEDENGTLAM